MFHLLQLDVSNYWKIDHSAWELNPVMTLVGIVSPFLLSRQLYLVISCYSVSNNYFLYIEHSRTRNQEINTCWRLNSKYLLIISVNTFQMATQRLGWWQVSIGKGTVSNFMGKSAVIGGQGLWRHFRSRSPVSDNWWFCRRQRVWDLVKLICVISEVD